MKRLCSYTILAFANVLCINTALASSSDEKSEKNDAGNTTIESNEREYKKIQTNIRDLIQILNASNRTSVEPGIGPQLVQSNRAFLNALEAFKGRDWISVINELQTFLNLSQKPDPQNWLKAQFMLGRAYEEQGQLTRATRAYTRYLASFTTNPTKDLNDLSETFERLVKISTKATESNQKELLNLLSAMAALDHPASVAAEFKYLTAVAGAKNSQNNLAINWLDSVSGTANSTETKARSQHFRALIAIKDKDWNTAEQYLSSVLKLDGISQKSKDNANISLARVQIKLKKMQLALGSYNSINENSEEYRDASFEKIFLLMRLNKDDEARNLAHQWIAKYPDHQDSTQVRVLCSWLDLRAGDLNAAKSSIEGTNAKLAEIQTALNKNFQSSKLRHEDAVKLANLTRGQVAPAQELEELLSMFRQTAEFQIRLSDIEGAERNLIYAIAKSDLRTYKPSITNRLAQLDKSADEILQAGAKLVYIERQRLEGRLSELDKQKLNASERRRKALFEKQSQLSRMSKQWSTWVGPAEQLVKLAQEWERINKLKAESIAGEHTGQTKPNNENSYELNEFAGKLNGVKHDMLNTLRDIKKQQAANIVSQSKIDDTIYILRQYSNALFDESKILAAYEPEPGKILDSLDDDDSRQAWDLWSEAIKLVHISIKELRTGSAQDLANTFIALDKLERTRNSIQADLAHLTSVIETYGGESLNGILTHFENGINQRLARQYKWAGDLEYLKYVQLKGSHEATSKKHDLELQILSDNLHDVEQGRTTQWPR